MKNKINIELEEYELKFIKGILKDIKNENKYENINKTLNEIFDKTCNEIIDKIERRMNNEK